MRSHPLYILLWIPLTIASLVLSVGSIHTLWVSPDARTPKHFEWGREAHEAVVSVAVVMLLPAILVFSSCIYFRPRREDAMEAAGDKKP